MFGLFKPKTIALGPVTFDFDILIERPVADVYPLIDWADPRNAKRQLGHRVEGEGSSYSLVLDSMPEHRFYFEVAEAVPNRTYEFADTVEPQMGKFASGTERYELEERHPGQCILRLINKVQFIDGLTMDQLEHEMLVMSVATNDALAKLKVFAEMGVEAAKSVEDCSTGF